jgi:hypothetical protein
MSTTVTRTVTLNTEGKREALGLVRAGGDY